MPDIYILVPCGEYVHKSMVCNECKGAGRVPVDASSFLVCAIRPVGVYLQDGQWWRVCAVCRGSGLNLAQRGGG